MAFKLKSGNKISFKEMGSSPLLQNNDDEDENVYKLGLTELGEDPKDVYIEALKQKAINDPWGYKAKRRKYHKFYDDGECIGCTIRELEEGKEK